MKLNERQGSGMCNTASMNGRITMDVCARCLQLKAIFRKGLKYESKM